MKAAAILVGVVAVVGIAFGFMTTPGAGACVFVEGCFWILLLLCHSKKEE